ncbi:hypothetical protein Ancab_005769 [Ancistrocladus abbreviatus]
MFSSNENACVLPEPTLRLGGHAINHSPFLHHQHNFLLSDYFPPSESNPPQTVMAAGSVNQHSENHRTMDENYNGICVSNGTFQYQKSHQKQDRHTKIYTAHGLRDRRVRLSMSIAREFFDLQDMLGFTKASETLEWLLRKSKTAIEELATKHKGSRAANIRARSLSSTPKCETALSPGSNGCVDQLMSESFARFTTVEKKKCQRVRVDIVVAKEMRAKARARARERTKEKMNRKMLSGLDTDRRTTNVPFPYHVRSENHHKLCTRLSFHSESVPVSGSKQSGPQNQAYHDFGASGLTTNSSHSAFNAFNLPTGNVQALSDQDHLNLSGKVQARVV